MDLSPPVHAATAALNGAVLRCFTGMDSMSDEAAENSPENPFIARLMTLLRQGSGSQERSG